MHRNRIYQFATVGEGPLAFAYRGEPTVLEIGDNNTIREGVTIHRGLATDRGRTVNRVRRRSHMRWTAAGKNGGPRINCTMDGTFTIPNDTDDDPADGNREVTNQWIMDSNEFVLETACALRRHLPRMEPGPTPRRRQHGLRTAVVGEIPPPLAAHGPVPRGGGGMPAVPLSEIARHEGDGVWRVTSRANDWMEG